MGCVSSHLLNREDDFTQLGSSAFSNHIVSLTSTTYGLLTLDPPPTTPPTPPTRFTLGSLFPSPLTEPKSLWSEPIPLRTERYDPEVINSWELMDGLDADSFRFSPLPPPKPFAFRVTNLNKENSNPNSLNRIHESSVSVNHSLDKFESLYPPKGENRVVLYTTTLRGVRKTFEACNAVRAAIEGFGVIICERDVSMDRGFREELSELMKGKEGEAMVPPRLFVNGRYVGGAEEVFRIVEEGWFSKVLDGMPKRRAGFVCEGCGDTRFLPCFHCNGSCKLVMVVKEKEEVGKKQGRTVVVKCPDCNENGLVLCPICS